ncbi:MAG TPA: hypothetical protein PLQ67_08450, partial [Burkholderiaceae bacterium]|nr:hypothetical protein [Burkholderiaceae bacterium]
MATAPAALAPPPIKPAHKPQTPRTPQPPARPTAKLSPILARPASVSAMHLHLALDSVPAAKQPGTRLADAALSQAAQLRESLVFTRHLAQAVPRTITKGATESADLARLLWQGGEEAQQFKQALREGAQLLVHERDQAANVLGQFVADKQAHIDTLLAQGQHEAAAQEISDLYISSALAATPGVGVAWVSGYLALTSARAAKALAQTAQLQKVQAAMMRNKASFTKTVRTGTGVVAAGAVGMAAIDQEPIHLYYDRRSHHIPAALYGAPPNVKAVTLKFGHFSASAWAGVNVTVGNPIGTAEMRRAGKGGKAQNQVVNEQHQTALLLGGGVHFGPKNASARRSRML